MNTEISYMYRDGDNYKQFHTIVVEGIITWAQIEQCLDEGEYFIPDQVGLEELQWRMTSFPDQQSDHIWHEIHEGDVAETEVGPTIDLTAEQLLGLFLLAKDNWDDGAAMERLGLTFLDDDEFGEEEWDEEWKDDE